MDNTDQQQLNLFEEGGLGDDGARIDPVSGNEVPAGSMAKEVRDDIPAQLSEGEYVVPADVVRYYGVKFFEDLRSQAKEGLMGMERDGRIGGEPVGGAVGQEPLTPEEEMMLREMMGMAAGGMVPQRQNNEVMSPMATQGYNPMEQQQMLYSVPKPAGNMRGFQTGGLSQSSFDPAQYRTVGSTYYQSPTTSTPSQQGPVTIVPHVDDNGVLLNVPMVDTDGDGKPDTPQAGYVIPPGRGFKPQGQTTETPVSTDTDRDGGGEDNRPSGSTTTTGGEEERRTGFSAEDLNNMVNDPIAAIDNTIENLGKSGLSALEKKGAQVGLGFAGSLLGPVGMAVGAAGLKGAEALSKANDVASALAGLEHARATGLIDESVYDKKVKSLQDLMEDDLGLDILSRTGYINKEANFKYNQILDKTTGTNLTGPGPKSAIPMSTLGYDKPPQFGGGGDGDGPDTSWEGSEEGKATTAAAEAGLAEARASGETEELGTTEEYSAATGGGGLYNKGGLIEKPKTTTKKSPTRGKRGLGKK